MEGAGHKSECGDLQQCRQLSEKAVHPMSVCFWM